MNQHFSLFLQKKKPILKHLLDVLLSKYSYASILGSDVTGTRYLLDRSSTTISPAWLEECGFVAKIYHDGFYSEYSFNDIEESSIDQIVQEIDELAKKSGNKTHLNLPMLKDETLTKVFSRPFEGKSYSAKEILAFMEQERKCAFEEFSSLINVNFSIEEVDFSKLFISKNRDLEQYYPWTGAKMMMLVHKDQTIKYAYNGFGDNSTQRVLDIFRDNWKSCGKLAIELLDATSPVPGVYDVITDPSITGLIAHEAFGHGVEMDQFVKDRALAKEFMNKEVASPLVTMHDGAASCFSVASYFFDDDGVLAQDTTIIKNGVLVQGICDSMAAAELGINPTGNSRRQSFSRKAYTRMTNTFFEKGNSKLEDMIKSISYGYFIGITNNGMEDPKNWGIQCTALYGREIKDGKFTGKMISPVVMSGYVIDLLKSISMVADDGYIEGTGGCGKGYKEWVRVSTGGAYLKAKVKIG
jgi:TldD protein